MPSATDAERDRALRDVVDVLLQLLAERVEQLVQADELRALHVPVRVLDLQVQVDGAGQPAVEQLTDARADVERQIVASLVHGGNSHPITGWRYPAPDRPGAAMHCCDDRSSTAAIASPAGRVPCLPGKRRCLHRRPRLERIKPCPQLWMALPEAG